MEVCVDSVKSAVEAERGGALRLELCTNLMEGGTTPSLGMLRVIKEECNLPVFVLIRPRGGDFVYSDVELEVMRHDIKLFKASRADGFVLGVLNRRGEVDYERCEEFITTCRPLPVTFHRAFDMCEDPMSSLEAIISLGFQRILTSGQDSSALEGLPLLKELVSCANDRIIIMPGGGITRRNLERILKGSGAREFHCSARTSEQSTMSYRNSNVFMGASLRPPEFSMKFADAGLIQALNEIYQNFEDAQP
ncbi:copper homeostasis protein cutC homolog [Amphiura filiformis]|uniref:copper homeostasis protein cutC homolog n=1 Tax=Amphiura filiformis TaxID=82378 RepID=UPI003B2157FC